MLGKWHRDFGNKRDVILKLHTGQGKTLIGLLILQARINAGFGPALYLCPNNFLINQTCDQADQFGIKVCTTEDDLPVDFLDGKTIFVTSVQKLFNGRTRFKTGSQSIGVETILMDDCHACINAIRDSFSLKFTRDDAAYDQLLSLFGPSLELQGAGTFADIKNKSGDALQAVPYWDWRDKHSEVVNIIAKVAASKNVKFVWPVVKDILNEVKSHQDFEELSMAVEDIISGMSFGSKADRFESAFNSLGKALGFASERPDKEWKQGPDNLWALRDGEYLLVECKSEVHLNRAEINKQETGQMNNGVAWFGKTYGAATSKNVIDHPDEQNVIGYSFFARRENHANKRAC